MRLHRYLFIPVFVICVRTEPCSEYGCPLRTRPEPFLPAPPGHTPRCAKPGQTFCESLDHYPQQLIRFLVDKWVFDYKTILIDESRDDFNSYRREPNYQEGYVYNRPEVPQYYPQPLPFLPPQYPYGGPPSPVYGPPLPQPPNTTHHQGYNYPAPSRSHNNPFLPQTALPPQLSHIQHQFPRQHHSNPFLYPQESVLNPLGQNQGWWANRFTRSSEKQGPPSQFSARHSRKENPLLEFGSAKKNRTKRQTDSAQETSLCPTTSQFIMPKAALNNKGNWMYVVNLQEQDDRYTQLVRSETCAATTCNGLCSLPPGYTSRCQQQYVQKRLIALEGSGDRLYTDVFWFPHCCTCQVAQNN